MAAIATTRKSRPRNALEGFALTAILQSFPTFAAAALLLKLCGNHDLVGDPGVAIFVAFASLVHAMVAVTLGPSIPALFKTLYKPAFFDGSLSLQDKITEWRTHPTASLQLVAIVLMLSVMAVGDGERGVRVRCSARDRPAMGRADLLYWKLSTAVKSTYDMGCYYCLGDSH